MADWKGSSRRKRLGSNSAWQRIRKRILARDPICRCDGRCGGHQPGQCPNPSTQCDHINADDDDSPRSLQGLCTPCHRWKSSSEGGRAIHRGTRTITRKYHAKRPEEAHPGLQ